MKHNSSQEKGMNGGGQEKKRQQFLIQHMSLSR